MTEVEFDAPLQECPLCGERSLTAFDRDFRGHSLSKCRSCGTKLVNPQFSDAHLRRFYASYISHDVPLGLDEGAPLAHHLRPHVRLTAKRRALTLLASFIRPGRILMVGCGDGMELEVARAAGWQPEGYDVDPITTARVAARVGVPVHCGDFSNLGERGRFDVLFMDQVIEHPKDPARYLRAADELLRPGGLLYLATPNIGSLGNRYKTSLDKLGVRGARRGKHYNTKHHLFFFTPQVLAKLLRGRFGFEVLVVRASLKPQLNPVTALFGRWFPVLDSSFILVARKPGPAKP